MNVKNLSAWLNDLQNCHMTEMDLSLERVREVATRLNLLKPFSDVITVAGTNGKGSCVAGLEAIYLAAGKKVGVFSSPILFRHNEYVRVQGKEASDDDFCAAFERIEFMRGDLTLTPFEFNALAALIIFQAAELDIWILEVGLGGRFDAVNVIDADVAIVASIGIDHVEWLGETREKIAYEKAGIFRTAKPVVYGDFDPPQTLIDYAKKIAAPLFCQQKEFGFEKNKKNNNLSWNWWSEKKSLHNLPLPHLALQNMSCVLMAIELLQDRHPITKKEIEIGLQNIKLTGRIEVVSGKIPQIFDVSHNPASAAWLATWLQENNCIGKTRAVFSMLGDKDITGTLEEIKNHIHEWHIAPLVIKRGAGLEKLQNSFIQVQINNNKIISHLSITEAYSAALAVSMPGEDRVVIFGSFHTVAETFKARACASTS